MANSHKGVEAPNKKKKRSFVDIFIALALIVGVGLLLYPTISNRWNEAHASKAIAGYSEAVNNLAEADYSDILRAAQDYNEALKSNTDRFHPTEEETAAYNQLLDVQGNGIMGYIEIPIIKVKLPIYHGVDEAILQVAAGHIEGSSLPIGGEGTHAAISGHRGLTSATLFTHLDKLGAGDKFYIHVLNETMCYKVTETNVVLPDEVDLLAIDPEKDLCTLITCTPYGVNSHRLLVLGERVEYDAAQDSSQANSGSAASTSEPAEGSDEKAPVGILIFAALLLALVVAALCFFFAGNSNSKVDPDSSSDTQQDTQKSKN